MRVEKRMKRDVITVRPDDPIRHAMELLKGHHIRQLPVVEDGKVVGIITDRDLREASASSAISLSIWELNYLLEQTTVKEIMTKDVITITSETPVEEAARLIHDLKIGGLPVVDEEKLVGIITEVDLLEMFLEVMGINGASVRIDVVLSDDPKDFEIASKIVQDTGGEILSVAISRAEDVPDEKVCFFRLGPCDPAPIKAALTKAGHKVLSTVHTP
jgi:acetoin utilization protein AcuB